MSKCYTQNGSAVRGLVLVLALVALGWIIYLIMLPTTLQERETSLFIKVMIGAAILVFVIWRCLPKKGVETFWLSHDGESEPTGPYTAAQIVAMWRAGQITTRGLCMVEGETQWMPLIKFAHRFDVSLEDTKNKTGFSFRRVALGVLVAFLLLIVLAMMTTAPNGMTMDEYRRARTRKQSVQEALQSPSVKDALDDLTERAKREAQRQRTSTVPSLPPSALEK